MLELVVFGCGGCSQTQTILFEHKPMVYSSGILCTSSKCKNHGKPFGLVSITYQQPKPLPKPPTDLSCLKLSNQNWFGHNFSGYAFNSSDCSGTNFTRCDLSNTVWCNANLVGAVLIAARIDGANFSYAKRDEKDHPIPGYLVNKDGRLEKNNVG